MQSRLEPWGFEPQIPPCHGGVIPFHYGPRTERTRPYRAAGDQTMKFIPAREGVNLLCRIVGCASPHLLSLGMTTPMSTTQSADVHGKGRQSAFVFDLDGT